ncbi:MAG: two-component sensor histidine kinase, partial [Quisquiliibacterium sp.]
MSVFRFALGIMLVVLVVFGGHVDVIDPAGSPVLFAGVAITYLVFSVIWIALARGVPKGFDLQLLLQVAADLMLLALLMHAAGGPRSGVGLLLVAAVGGASVISTALRSAFTAAIATLFVLGDAVLQTSRVGWADFGQLTPAAMLGGACFAIGLLVNRLAIRLEAQEALAEQRGEDLHAQLLINRLVISELEQGVIVLDSQGRV